MLVSVRNMASAAPDAIGVVSLGYKAAEGVAVLTRNGSAGA